MSNTSILDNPRVIVDSMESTFELNVEVTNKAYFYICNAWSSKRTFIKHLINAFYKDACVLHRGSARCCIAGIRVSSQEAIASAMEDYYLLEMDTAGNEKILEDYLKSLPVELRNRTLGYCSNSSNKVLSGEALAALRYFVENNLQNLKNTLENNISSEVLEKLLAEE